MTLLFAGEAAGLTRVYFMRDITLLMVTSDWEDFSACTLTIQVAGGRQPQPKQNQGQEESNARTDIAHTESHPPTPPPPPVITLIA